MAGLPLEMRGSAFRRGESTPTEQIHAALGLPLVSMECAALVGSLYSRNSYLGVVAKK
jgi:hypothetical protein